MQFAEAREGLYRIFAGAIDSRFGDGYTAALVVRLEGSSTDGGHVAYRDDNLACGHRWPTADAALAFAIQKGREQAQRRSLTRSQVAA